jgi:hypothetical protein
MPHNISDTENRPDLNRLLDNPNQSEETWIADNESNVELGNGFKNTETLCRGIHPCMALRHSMSVDMVANLDVHIVE